jgi:hypothetical protein
MATIQDYKSGKVCEQIKKAFSVFESVEAPLNDTEVGKIMLHNVKELEPKKLTIDEAMKLIQEAKQCAIGDRVCRSLHTETPLAENLGTLMKSMNLSLLTPSFELPY